MGVRNSDSEMPSSKDELPSRALECKLSVRLPYAQRIRGKERPYQLDFWDFSPRRRSSSQGFLSMTRRQRRYRRGDATYRSRDTTAHQ